MSRLGRRLRKLRKKQSGGAPATKVGMKSTAKAGRQAPGTPKVPRRVARLSEAARRSAADTAQRMDEMGAIRDQQSATPKPSTPKASAPPSTATTAQDLADVGYGTGMSPSTATTAQDLADVGYGTGMTTPAPAPDPFQEPAPYQKGRDFGASFPVTTPSGPPIPGVSGPPEQAGDATTLDYDVFGEDPVPSSPLVGFPGPGFAEDSDPIFDPDQPGHMERDYEIGNITPPTPGIDTPLPDATPGQMAPDPSYLPPPIDMSEEEMDDLVSQIEAQRSAEKQQERQSNILNLRDYLKRAGLRKILPGLRGMGLAD